LSRKLVVKAFLWYGILGSLTSAISYFFINIQNGWPKVPLAGGNDPVYIKATAMTLAAIVFSQVGAVFNCRTEKQSVFKVGMFSNKQVNFGVVFEIFLISALVYLPLFQSIFHTASLRLSDCLLLFIWPPLILLIEEARKAFVRRKMFRKHN
jgi:Cation transport ATPase